MACESQGREQRRAGFAFPLDGRCLYILESRSSASFIHLFLFSCIGDPNAPVCNLCLAELLQGDGMERGQPVCKFDSCFPWSVCVSFLFGRLLRSGPGFQLYLISPSHGVSISPFPNPQMLYFERLMLWMPCRRCTALSATSLRRVSSTSRTHAMYC